MTFAERRAVFQNNVHRIVEIVAAVHPTFERALQKLDGGFLIGGVFNPIAAHKDAVLKHRRADVVEIDDAQIFGLVQFAGFGIDRFEDLGVFIVCHCFGGIHFAVEQERHVERLLHDGHVRFVVRVNACFAHRGEQFKFIAVTPRADFFTFPIFRFGDARIFPRNFERARALERLRNVHEVCALFNRSQNFRQPRDAKFCAAGSDHLLRHNFNCARFDGDIQTLFFPETFIERGIVTAELRLGDPLQLQSYFFQITAGCRRG